MYTFDGVDAAGMVAPTGLPLIEKMPACMAIIDKAPSRGMARCLLALQQGGLRPIEVMVVRSDGSTFIVFTLLLGLNPSPCHDLSFCHMAPEFLFARFEGGVAKLFDLKSQN